jgi:putative tryptophan/tyrosine transport system substrate-binding protein
MRGPVRRRDFIALAAGAAVAWPHNGHAQQAQMPVAGFLRVTTPDARLIAAFRDGLKEAGYTEGQNIAIEFRWAENHPDRLAALASDLIRRKVDVIVAGGLSAAAAAKTATATIPIVAAVGDDPVGSGLVKSINRPGANLTGVSFYSGPELNSKRMEFLRMLSPQIKVVALLINPIRSYDQAHEQRQISEARQAAQAMGMQLRALRIQSDGEIDAAFAVIEREQIGAFLIAGDAFFTSRMGRIVAFSTRQGVPGLFTIREFAAAGGLMSYGASQTDAYRRAALYVGKVLQGAKPAELPFMLPAKYELIINLNAAKAMGRAIPTPLLALADDVIE